MIVWLQILVAQNALIIAGLAAMCVYAFAEQRSAKRFRAQHTQDTDDQLRYADSMARQLLLVAGGKGKRQNNRHNEYGVVTHENGHGDSSR